MRLRRLAGFSAMGVAVILVLAGCAAPEPQIVEGSRLSIAVPGPFTSANGGTAGASSAADQAVAHLTSSGFVRLGGSGSLTTNTDFGSVAKISDNPLKVKYTLRDGVTWSDGVPIDAADLLLAWAANSGSLNTVAAKRDADGNITNQDALNKGVFFDSGVSGSGLDLVTQVPKIGDDDRSITLTFTRPFSDWERVFPRQLLPVHVVMQHARPSKDYSPDAAKKAFVNAVENGDASVLNPVSIFWNHGFDMTNMPADRSLTLSSGPYVVTGAKENGSVTLTANERFTWGPLPRVQTIVLRLIDDPADRAAALVSGDADLMLADATQQLNARLQDAQSLRLLRAPGSAYEHLDLSFTSSGPFDAKTYAGSTERARKVREAFLLTVPRSQLLRTLIEPLEPKAVLRNSFTAAPGSAGYDGVVAGNGSKDYAAVDLDRARTLLAGAGVTTPLTVRLLYPAGDPLRAAEFRQIQASAARAGFQVTDASASDWKQRLGDRSYDAALYAWEMPATTVPAMESVFGTDGSRNLNGLSDATIDAVLEKLGAEYDADKRHALTTRLEHDLVDDAYGLPLYQLPVVVAVDKRAVSSVRARPDLSSLLADYADWSPVVATTSPR